MAILAPILLLGLSPSVVRAEGDGIADHVVISEIYINAVNEFDSEWIELHNPTNTQVDISDWRIRTSSLLIPVIEIPSNTKIAPHSFFLIADRGFSTRKDNPAWPNADYEKEIVLINVNGWIRLEDSAGSKIDLVGWGLGAQFETSPYPDNPPQSESLERKTHPDTIDRGYGNAWDEDNNSSDFMITGSSEHPYQDLSPKNSDPANAVAPFPELPSVILLSSGLAFLLLLVALRKAWQKSIEEAKA